MQQISRKNWLILQSNNESKSDSQSNSQNQHKSNIAKNQTNPYVIKSVAKSEIKKLSEKLESNIKLQQISIIVKLPTNQEHQKSDILETKYLYIL